MKFVTPIYGVSVPLGVLKKQLHFPTILFTAKKIVRDIPIIHSIGYTKRSAFILKLTTSFYLSLPFLLDKKRAYLT